MDRDDLKKAMRYSQLYGGNFIRHKSINSMSHMTTKVMAIPRGLYSNDEGKSLTMPDEITPPTNTKADREYLKMTITEYKNFAEAIQQGCFLNEQGNACKVKNAKTKKLKNLRYKYRKSPFLQASMIWKAQIHVIQMELNKRMAASRGN